ncbi:MAG TPA: ATP-binding cassette domain-containing protein [Ignavibacteriaceae bacterium]|nr:ATP-binding cassette domain-containing protein [Ignavibacteriaceae bacterium]
MIELSNVSLEFGDRPILKDISLSINEGEIAIILGPSGAGKSSILKIILGLWQPDSGKVTVDGINIAGMSEVQILPIRSKMGIVFQANALFDSLNVEDNVAYFLREHSKLNSKDIRNKVSEILSFVNLKGTEKIYIDQLSGGMKKRVAIARALSFDPEIILYDEPTTGLDPINSKSILDLIKRVSNRGATSVVVTHILNDAISIGDTLSVINEGAVVQTGTVHDLLNSKNPFIKDFFYEVYQDAALLKKTISE